MIFPSKGPSTEIQISNPDITIGNGLTREDRAAVHSLEDLQILQHFLASLSKGEGRRRRVSDNLVLPAIQWVED